jgi:hypothetical protein
MGCINEQVGRFTIESRRESFYIHADYGYEPDTCAIRALGMGDISPHILRSFFLGFPRPPEYRGGSE